jgi:hypothetical protein
MESGLIVGVLAGVAQGTVGGERSCPVGFGQDRAEPFAPGDPAVGVGEFLGRPERVGMNWVDQGRANPFVGAEALVDGGDGGVARAPRGVVDPGADLSNR